jgi:hypothetical protein
VAGAASITDSLCQTARGQASALREMLGTRPPSVLSASKAIEEGGSAAKRWCGSRRTRWPPCGQASPFIGRDCRPITRAGAPCGASPRCRGASLHTLGPPLSSPGYCSFARVIQQAPCTRGRIARRFDTRGAPRARLIKLDPQAPLPTSTNGITRMTPSNERGCGMRTYNLDKADPHIMEIARATPHIAVYGQVGRDGGEPRVLETCSCTTSAGRPMHPRAARSARDEIFAVRRASNARLYALAITSLRPMGSIPPGRPRRRSKIEDCRSRR